MLSISHFLGSNKNKLVFVFSPRHSSGPGKCYSIRFDPQNYDSFELLDKILLIFPHIFRIALGNYSKPSSVAQMDKVSIFVHEKGKFLYFREKDNMPNNYMIDPDLLQFSIMVLCVVYSEQ